MSLTTLFRLNYIQQKQMNKMYGKNLARHIASTKKLVKLLKCKYKSEFDNQIDQWNSVEIDKKFEHDWIVIPLGDGKDCRKCGATEKSENEPCKGKIYE